MKDKLNIIPMDEGHLDEVLLIEESYSANPWSRELFSREFNSRFSYNFVLKYDNEIAGFSNFWMLFEVVELNNIAVKDKFRGRGFGSYLLQFIIEASRVFNAKKIFLEVKENNFPAIMLYEKKGFVNIGIRKKYYSDGKDAILMEKVIS